MKLTLDPEVRLKKHDNFWKGLHMTLLSIISNGKSKLAPGSGVSINPFSGMVTVQTYSYIMPKVEEYLERIQTRVQRQVIIKAKIVEIDSSFGLDTGLDFSDLFGTTYHGDKSSLEFNYATPGFSNFKATLTLLSKFGKTNVLSNPVISTLNNQKAMIRVGEIEYFSTGEETNFTPLAGATTSIQTQNIELQPYFSGISLGVTPQISKNDYIMMKIMPSINHVTQHDVRITIPSFSGKPTEMVIPTAKILLREAETMVRVRNGEIIVIGGLTQDGARITRSGLPAIGYDAATERAEESWKKNIIILLQPIIVKDGNWNDTLKEFRENMSLI